jgi:hypothetical protein
VSTDNGTGAQGNIARNLNIPWGLSRAIYAVIDGFRRFCQSNEKTEGSDEGDE